MTDPNKNLTFPPSFLYSLDLLYGYNKYEIAQIEAAGPRAYIEAREKELRDLAQRIEEEKKELGIID